MDKFSLGRVVSEPDERNYPLSVFLEGEGSASKLDAILAAALPFHSKKMQAWMKAITAAVQAAPSPTPTPTPTPTPDPTPTPPAGKVVVWHDPDQLDQGQTGHCVGFGWSQFLNTLGSEQFSDHCTDNDGHALYYECKVIDGEAGKENGSSVHSGAKATRNRGHIRAYAWAADIHEIIAWVSQYGPMTVGTDWYDGMFSPDSSGFVYPTGALAGGHCYIIVGYDNTDPAGEVFTFQNSWGPDWGQNGYFKMYVSDFALLLAAQGEACTSVEVV